MYVYVTHSVCLSVLPATVILPSPHQEYVPFERVLGKQVGQVFKNVLDKNKLDFYGPAIVNKYE